MLRAALALGSVSLFILAAGCDTPGGPPPVMPPPIQGDKPPAPPPPSPSPVGTPVSLESVGLDASAIDKSVDPCSDFYRFACGNWIKNTPIPADRPLASRSFVSITDRNEDDIHKILEAAAQSPGEDPVNKKIGAFYGACMDEKSIDAAGAKPIAGLLAAAKRVSDKGALVGALVTLHKAGVWALFDVSDEQDFKDATKIITGVDQNGLGLPNKEYYTREDDKSKELRKKYQEHVARMLELAGYSKAAAQTGATDVMKVEHDIALVSKTPTDRRDPKGMYNRVNRDGLAKLTPSIAWDKYFKGIGFPDLKEITVTSVPYFEGLEKIIASTKPAEWQSYLAWHVVRSTAPMLSKPFADEAFTMEQTLTGQKEQRARWKRCVNATDRALGELVAQPWLKLRFTAESKDAAIHFVTEISKAFNQEVDKLDWMDAPTKARAHDKLKAMEYLIGYPSKWKPYDFDIKPGAYAENALASRGYELKRSLKKVGLPNDRSEWNANPQIVNAYYSPLKNHMVFPAGILQPPFFSPKADVPVNLGALGMVVGHELTHGFDDQGAQFDEKGNLVDWWSPSVGEKFKAKTGCIEQEYSGFEALPGLKVNGKLTLGENIADNAGILLAFHAYRAMRNGAAEVLLAEGFTEDQQFFLGAGQAWCSKLADEYLRLRVQGDPHSPPQYRVNGSLSNLAEFSEAFHCVPGSAMRRKDACNVW